MTGGGFLPRRVLGLGLVLSAALATAPALAQEGIPGVATGVGNRFLQTQTPLTNGAGVLEALFTHRFAQAAKDSEGNGLLGLGGGSYVMLGLDYAIVKNLSVQVYWSNASYDYEFALKGTLLRPTEKLPLAVGLRGGLNWITASYAEKQSGAFGQLLVAATIADRVTLSVAPAWVQRTPYHADVWNVPLAAQVRIGSSLAAIAEFVPKKNWSPETTYQWSFAVEKQVYHHRFLIWIGNALPTTMDQLIGGDFNGDVTDRNLHIGFNISRAFDLR